MQLTDHNLKILSIIFFAVLFLTGILIHKDYGVNWDSGIQRTAGIMNVDYLEGESDELINDREKYHGPAFEILLIYVERFFDITEPRNIYTQRHFITFLTFFLATAALFFLLYERLRDYRYSLLGCLFFVLSPRLFGDAFHNIKDIPFLSFFTISILFLVKTFRYKKIYWAVLAGIFSGIAISTRILGVLIPLFFLMYLFYLIIFERKELTRLLLLLLIYIVILIPVVIFSWPILLENPLFHFMNAFSEMSKFPWEGTNFYFGKHIPATEIQWHYLPVWIIISTPLIFILFFLFGVFDSGKGILKNIHSLTINNKIDLLMLLWFFSPIFAIIILQSVVYDAWRHVFFIYPALIVIAVLGVQFIYRLINNSNFSVLKYLITGIIILALLSITMWSIKNHPYQYVYFSQPFRANMEYIKNNFELDFYGVSYKQVLEYIVANDKRDLIKIKAANLPGIINKELLPRHEKHRIEYVYDEHEADYFITNLRGTSVEAYSYPIYHSIKVNGTTIMVAYKLK